MASFGLTPQTINYGNGRSASITNNGIQANGFGGRVGFSGSTAGTQYFDRGNLGGVRSGGMGGGGSYGGGGTGIANGRGASHGIGAGLQNDLNSANAANEARYQEALGINASGGAAQQANLKSGYADLYAYGDANKTEALGLVSQIGGAARQREAQQTARQSGSANQSLIGRGLGNSTVMDSVQRGIQDDSALRNRELDEASYGRQAGVIQHAGDQGYASRQRYADSSTGLMGDLQSQRLGIIGSKTDQGPNVGAYTQALGQPGAFGGGNAYRPNSPYSSGRESQQRYADQVSQSLNRGPAVQQQQQTRSNIADRKIDNGSAIPGVGGMMGAVNRFGNGRSNGRPIQYTDASGNHLTYSNGQFQQMNPDTLSWENTQNPGLAPSQQEEDNYYYGGY